MDYRQSPQNSVFYTWFLWFVMALFYYFQCGTLTFTSVAGNFLISKFQTNEVGLALLTSSFIYSYLLMQVIVGILFDRFSSRLLFSSATLCFAVGLILFNLSHELYWGMFAMTLSGFGASFAFVGTLYVTNQWLPTKLQPIAAAMTSMCRGIAVMTFGFGFAISSKYLSWPEIFWLLAIIALIIFLLNATFVRENKTVKPTTKPKLEWSAIKTLLTTTQIWLVAFYIGFSYVNIVAIVNVWRIHAIEHVFKTAPEMAVLMNSFGPAGYIIGALVVGYLCTRLDRFKVFFVIGSIGQLTCLIMGHYIITELGLRAMFFFGLSFFTSAAILTFPLAKRIASANTEGIALGFVNMFSMLISACVLPIIGLILQLTHQNYDWAVVPVLVCIIIGFIIALFIKEPVGN